MVLMNLFTGQQWRSRQRTNLWTRVGEKDRVRWREKHGSICTNMQNSPFKDHSLVMAKGFG